MRVPALGPDLDAVQEGTKAGICGSKRHGTAYGLQPSSGWNPIRKICGGLNLVRPAGNGRPLKLQGRVVLHRCSDEYQF